MYLVTFHPCVHVCKTEYGSGLWTVCWGDSHVPFKNFKMPIFHIFWQFSFLPFYILGYLSDAYSNSYIHSYTDGVGCHAHQEYGEEMLMRRQTGRELLSWLNKQTDLKMTTQLLLCYFVYMWRTLPPFPSSNSVLGPYFPLRAACLFTHGKNTYIWICIITSLML